MTRTVRRSARCVRPGPWWMALALPALALRAWGAEGGSTPKETAPSASLAEAEERGHRVVEPLRTRAPEPVVLQGGTVLTAAGERYDDGYVVLVGGKIEAVGEGQAPQVPGAHVVDVTGRFVTPGLIDTHSHLGVYPAPGAAAHEDGNEATAPTTPGVWAEHSVWPQDPGFGLAAAGGITAMQILPGSANLIGGRGFVVEVVPARGSRAMRFPGAPDTLKMACGENPKRVYGAKGGPSTRMGNLRGQREAFLEAKSYERKWQEQDRRKVEGTPKGRKDRGAGEDHVRKPDPPERDLDKETLVGVLRGDILAQVHCYMADDMLAFLQVADEMGFEVRSFHHALEAYKIRDVLAARGVGVSTWADWWGFKLEAYDGIQENAALVAQAGGRAIIHSDSGIGIQRLNQEASKAWHAGLRAGIDLKEDDALKWITLNPAWALGIDDQTGSLEVGKRADVVVWDAHPFSVYARAHWVFVAGELQFDADRPRTWSDFEIGQDLP